MVAAFAVLSAPCFVARSTPRVSRTRRRARVTAAIPFDAPDNVKRLDDLEAARQRRVAPIDGAFALSEDVVAGLHARIPVLAEIDAKLGESLRRADWDPKDHRVYSWAWRNLSPWRPSALLVTAGVLAGASAVRAAVDYMRPRVSAAMLLRAAVRLDLVATIVLAGVVPVVLCAFALAVRSPRRVPTDAVRRSLVMFLSSAMVLPAVAAVAATGNAGLALGAGAAVRLLALSTALWLWRDLRREVFLSRALLTRFFTAWRALATLLVILFGSALRVAALTYAPAASLKDTLAARATDLRLRLASRFPVALSLFADPRGLFFLASLVLIGATLYGMYVVVFVLDFFRVRHHRRTESVFASRLIRAGVYSPNVRPELATYLSSAPEGTEAFAAAPAMMLRKVTGLLGVESSMLSSDEPPPIFKMLDQEKVVMEAEGMTQWMPTRDQFVPLSENLSKAKRTTDALLTWARPLEESQQSLSFAEFFETLEEHEYMFDANSGQWIFPDIDDDDTQTNKVDETFNFPEQQLASDSATSAPFPDDADDDDADSSVTVLV